MQPPTGISAGGLRLSRFFIAPWFGLLLSAACAGAGGSLNLGGVLLAGAAPPAALAVSKAQRRMAARVSSVGAKAGDAEDADGSEVSAVQAPSNTLRWSRWFPRSRTCSELWREPGGRKDGFPEHRFPSPGRKFPSPDLKTTSPEP